jgi:DNA-directed RNA polymerase subunit N (RpoN/RPB10)
MQVKHPEKKDKWITVGDSEYNRLIAKGYKLKGKKLIKHESSSSVEEIMIKKSKKSKKISSDDISEPKPMRSKKRQSSSEDFGSFDEPAPKSKVRQFSSSEDFGDFDEPVILPKPSTMSETTKKSKKSVEPTPKSKSKKPIIVSSSSEEGDFDPTAESEEFETFTPNPEVEPTPDYQFTAFEQSGLYEPLYEIRCGTCGSPKPGKYRDLYESKLSQGRTPYQALTELGFNRPCCRKTLAFPPQICKYAEIKQSPTSTDQPVERLTSLTTNPYMTDVYRKSVTVSRVIDQDRPIGLQQVCIDKDGNTTYTPVTSAMLKSKKIGQTGKYTVHYL